MLKALEKEIISEKQFIKGETLATIYMGGGTPSLLTLLQVERLLSVIRKNYEVDKNAEITLEANPDDISREYLNGLLQIGINRLSMGIQSFHDEDLAFMNRLHDSSQSKLSIEMALDAGFDNLSLDLIYGLPGMGNDRWDENLKTALSFRLPHIAAYHLSYETGTVLEYRRKKKKVIPVDENRSLEHFYILTDRMETHGYEHYEISNFALPGGISKHNSAYWKGEKYLGVGPSAHSYNGQVRRWNMSKNSSYIRGIMKGYNVYDEEYLDNVNRLHDYLMTSLRTMWGADLKYIKTEWGTEYFNHVMKKAGPFIRSGKILNVEGKFILTREGMFIADHIIGELFL
jgi:oxygen-independent coproporphyrinogen-3 oxidase